MVKILLKLALQSILPDNIHDNIDLIIDYYRTEYLVLIERMSNNNCDNYYLMQYTGNKEEMDYFRNQIDQCTSYFSGDSFGYQMLDTIVYEEDVKSYTNLMFTPCFNKFSAPRDLQLTDNDSYENSARMAETIGSCLTAKFKPWFPRKSRKS